MLRGWKLAAVSVVTICVASGARPAAAVSLAERLRRLTGGGDDAAAASPTIRDDQVQPAAVAAEPTNRPRARAARDAAMAGTTKRSGGGGGSLFSGLRLPGFGGQGSGTNEDLSDAPMPYDPSELQAQGAATRTQPATAATAAPRRQPGAAAGPASTTPRRIAAASVPAATAPTTSRVARTSPRVDVDRHNELAEALSGLRDHVVADGSPTVDEGDAPPLVISAEEAPRYLRDSEASTAAEMQAPTTGGAAATRGPVDVADALIAAPAAAEPAVAPIVRPRVTAAITPTARPAAVANPGVRRSPPRAPAAETDIGAALRDETSATPPAAMPTLPQPVAPQIDDQPSDLGDVAAEAAPMFENPPLVGTPSSTPTTMPAVRPTIQPSILPTKTRPTTPTAPHAGNLRPRRDLLLSGRQPVIVSGVAGPQRITVGRTVEYRVSLENKGDESARELTATIAVPAWAEVIDAVGSNGAVDRTSAASESESNTIKWQLYELAPGAAQTLTLKLIPRSGRALQLGVAWDHAAVSSEATVQVEEPKLHMEITGPAEVLFGKSQRYTLTLSNPGTGDADEVSIELTPPGGDPASPVRHKVGSLAAGGTKSIELELTAREAGDLKMFAVAHAAGDLRIETVKTVLCRKADLAVDWRGPDKNFAGAVATYYLRVRNPGTAQADQVAVELNLPAGAELVDASAGHAWDAGRRVVGWKPGSLAPNEERFMQFRCKLTQPGVNQLEAVAQTASGDLSDVKNLPVTIEALADLKLVVSDPQGVIPVGDEATYEIKVQNRGLTAARGVNVTAMFSEGIDPINVEGGQHEIRDGRVSFRPIDTLPAGAEAVLRIHAKATAAGTHVFRAEVNCDDLDTKLAAEETTRFFIEEERWADASAAYSENGEETTR